MLFWGFKSYCYLILQVYSKVSGEQPHETPTIDVSSKEFYGEGYDDSDKRIPDMTIINRQLGRFPHSFIHSSYLIFKFVSFKLIVLLLLACLSGWNPKASLWDLLESTLTYQHRTYAEAIKKVIAKPVAS